MVQAGFKKKKNGLHVPKTDSTQFVYAESISGIPKRLTTAPFSQLTAISIAPHGGLTLAMMAISMMHQTT